MFRYLALMSNLASTEQTALVADFGSRLLRISPQWEMRFDGQGVKVFVADESQCLGAHLLSGGAGLVVGEIFHRQTNLHSDGRSFPALFGEQETAEVLASEGRSLTTSYWGNYVAFISHARTRARFVINDPTGPLPCYVTEVRGVRVVFSCLGDCLELGLKRFNVNWIFVRSRVVRGIFDVETSPLEEVSRVHRGEAWKFDSTARCASRSFYWHPSRFADASDPIVDPIVASDALRATVRSCVHSHAAAHSAVLQQTSGGLDSSIVLGCLDESPDGPQVTCYTKYVPGSPCDERRWARLAVERLGHRHVESKCEPGKFLYAERDALRPSVEPESCFAHWEKGPTERKLSEVYGATAAFSGEGGDANLCSTSYVFAVDHSLARYGLGLRTLGVAASVATRRDKTVWNVLWKAWKRRWTGTSLEEFESLLSNGSQLVHSDARRAAANSKHFPNPWFSESETVPLESLWRLGGLAYAPSFYDLSTSHHDEVPYSVAPLCAQPVFELCSRIPVDIHFDQGRIRGLARRAFTHEVPEPILRRQWKDRPLSMTSRVIQRNLPFIREALLDGDLAEQRILDRAAVEAALRSGPTANLAVSGEILQHLDLALWVRGCLQASRNARVL